MATDLTTQQAKSSMATLSQADRLQALYDLEFTTNIEPKEAAKQKQELFLAAAEQQINAETNENSPWHVDDQDTAEDAAIKEQMRQYQIYTRAMEIIKHRTEGDKAAFFLLSGDFREKRLDLFPPDGDWKEFRQVIADLVPGVDEEHKSGSAYAIEAFFNQQSTFQKAGLETADFVEIAQQGTTKLARIANQVGKVADDPEQVRQVVDDAKAMSVHAFDSKYSDPRVPPLEYSYFAEDDESGMMVIRVATPEQRKLLRGRMKERLVPAEQDLLHPITPARLYNVIANLGQWDNEYLAHQLISLLHELVRADPVCWATYGILTNETNDGKWVLQRDIDSITPNYPPHAIEKALRTMERYGMVEEMHTPEQTFWKAL